MRKSLGIIQFPDVLADTTGEQTLSSDIVNKILELYDKSKTKLYIQKFKDDNEEMCSYFGFVNVDVQDRKLLITSSPCLTITGEDLGWYFIQIDLSTKVGKVFTAYYNYIP